MIELSCLVSAARSCLSPVQPGTRPASSSSARSTRPPFCPPLPRSDGAEGARRVPRPAPLGDGRQRQPRRPGGRHRPQAGRGVLHRQMHLQVPEPADHPHLRLLQAFPEQWITCLVPESQTVFKVPGALQRILGLEEKPLPKLL